MKFLFAPDSFKGSITALDAAHMLTEVCNKTFGSVETIEVPVADGGEGTVDSLVIAANGIYGTYKVTGPLYEPVDAKFGLINEGKTAVIEMAQASGLPLIPAKKRNPLKATSKGTGELISHILDSGIKDLIIGIGGSATNDGGMGMLIALGAKFYDENNDLLSGCGEDLIKVKNMDISALNDKVRDVKITVICDVTNPLLGENGATYVYGRQKGAAAEKLKKLEEGMKNYAKVFEDECGMDIASFEGAGAAGGMGGALKSVLGATLKPGIEAVLDAVVFDEMIKDVDLVVTGEGYLDSQSVKFGKVPTGIAKRCSKSGVPVAVITGGMGEGAEEIYDIANITIMTTINAAMSIDTAMENATELYKGAAERLFKSIKMGMEIEKKINS